MKRIIPIILSFVLMLVLVACGSSNTQQENGAISENGDVTYYSSGPALAIFFVCKTYS